MTDDSPDVTDLTRRLEAAQKRCSEAVRALAPKHQGGEWEEMLAANAELLHAERELAAALGEPHAVPLEGFPVWWDVGAPLPELVATDYRTVLSFCVAERTPGREARDLEAIAWSTRDEPLLAEVEFERCVSARIGTPNDEVHEGHPLYGKGLEAYTAQRVVHSKWLAEAEAINRVHACYDPQFWRELSHYVFWFHDSTFECLARSWKIDVYLKGEVIASKSATPNLPHAETQRRGEG